MEYPREVGRMADGITKWEQAIDNFPRIAFDTVRVASEEPQRLRRAAEQP